MSSLDTEENCGCKIGRNAEKYGLSNLDDELKRERCEHELSLRDLADYVNTRILAAAINTVDADIAGDPASVYSVFASDDISTERRVTVTDQLTNTGIDIDELTDDFVSYQAVRHHLQNCLNMDTGRRGVETVEEGRGVIEWARQRGEKVIGRTLARLRRMDSLATGELNVTVTITITCKQCGGVYRIDELLDRGRCECSSPT